MARAERAKVAIIAEGRRAAKPLIRDKYEQAHGCRFEGSHLWLSAKKNDVLDGVYTGTSGGSVAEWLACWTQPQ